MRMFVLVLAAVWFQPLLHSRAREGRHASLLMKVARLLDLSECAMAAGMILLGCIAVESAVASSVDRTFVAVASTIASGIAR